MRDAAAPDQNDFQSLTRRLRGVMDFSLRVGGMRDALSAFDGTELAAFVSEAFSRLMAGDPEAKDVLAALGQALESSEWDGLRARASLIAQVGSDTRVATYLAPQAEVSPEGSPLQVPDFGAGRPLTLGERKSVARGQDPDVIARVLRDPDPAVIAILLGNPSVTEAQVVRLAARRPVNPEVLREVFRSLRWSTRQAVRLGLVQNPWCPVEIGVRLVPLLTTSERRSVGRGADLPAPVLSLCADLLL